MSLDDLVLQIKRYQPEKIILFGSFAVGKQTPDSDIDIAVIKKTDKSYHDRLIELRRLVKTTSPIDFFVFTPEELRKLAGKNSFVAEIVATGKVIYGQ
ncbi:nucleotidyltransferase domain-containing protein [Candidatus Woesebacteria bacterium]|nr:nucleotidyltransferase domain-containing protein [Candidatus Woesebacteria bacterium]